MNESPAPSNPAPRAPRVETNPTNAGPRPLRTWPAVMLVALMLLARFVPPALEEGMTRYWMVSVFGPLLCCLLLVLWWLTASRANWRERVFGTLGLFAFLSLTLVLVDHTMRGPGTTYLTLPMGMIAFAIAATLLARRAPLVRTGGALLAALGAFGFSALLRTEGMTGDYALSTKWRWTPTAEDALLAQSSTRSAKSAAPSTPPSAEVVLANLEWPGFRGADRAGRALGPHISTNWNAEPPRLLWKIPVGPAWSSFAVASPFLFTQEQRGPSETVACYDAPTGHEVWSRSLEARFDEPLGGPGPRATPTVSSNAVFVTGATGKLLRLSPAQGEIRWQVELKELAGRTSIPMWGFAASPLLADSVVIVYAGGAGNKAVLALDVATGALRWSGNAGADSYSSPQLTRLAGEDLVLMLSNEGLVALDPSTGAERLNYPWKFMNYRALQPRLVGDDTLLLPTGMNTGTRALRITKRDGRLAAQELWTSRNLKPDFSDLVTQGGYAYGFDGGIFACVDLKTGERQWKGGRYGKGQVLSLESSGALLVAAESGDVVLLRADPKELVELGSFKALEGKTWNHPVVVGDRLYLRNSQEAAAFQLALARDP